VESAEDDIEKCRLSAVIDERKHRRMPFEPTLEQQMVLSHNPAQHARVLAGPGTGKSTTMVGLLNRLLEENASLRIRILTFTRAATAELAEKVAIHSREAERPSTIHSFAISVLLRNPGTGGFPEPLRIVDTWEKESIVHPTLATRAGVQVRKLNKLVQEMASNWQSLTEEVNTEISEADRNRFRGAWNEHRLVLGYTLLEELPYALRRALHDHDDLAGIDFDLLLVDEYQDLNACDLEVLKLLSNKTECAIIGIGDDDQSIYSWRRAAPEGIRRFCGDYPQAMDYTLSVTLRCAKRIIEWANYVIQGDPDRPTNREVLEALPESSDGAVSLLRFKSERAEAKGIAEIVRVLVNKKGVAPKDILILMRTDNNGTFSKPIREEIEKLGIRCSDPSYVFVLLAEEDNRKLLELLRLLVNPNDSISWASLLKLTEGVGQTFFQYIYERAKQKGATFADELLAAHKEGFLGAPSSANRVKKKMDAVLHWLEANELPDEQPQEGWGNWIIGLTGDDDIELAPTEEFRKLLLELNNIAEDEQSLGRYLGQIEPLGKDLAQSQSDGVRIMRMGMSKGLTVRAAIVAGVEDGLVPRPNSDLSEERRILYVAMTRAKEYLFCTWARRRRGPTARAGNPSMNLRRYSHFLEGGPVESEDGRDFLEGRSYAP
jgi:DNA helicase II / ATP-dependent DNA helicase PcrA